jgi:hypothetical protein
MNSKSKTSTVAKSIFVILRKIGIETKKNFKDTKAIYERSGEVSTT